MKNKFLEIYSKIKRQGADKLLEWLEKSDFFTAPASSRFHGSYEGGLVEHSINVYNRLDKLVKAEGLPVSEETIAIVALLHDICKANYYKVDFRNTKDENGQWVKVPYYTVDDQLPYGHGEKSVYIISAFMKLTREESFAIRWHMGGFDSSVKGGDFSLSKAYETYPLALLVHLADMQATYLDEVRKDG